MELEPPAIQSWDGKAGTLTITLAKNFLKIVDIVTVTIYTAFFGYTVERQLSWNCSHYTNCGVKMIHSVELLNTNPNPLLSLSQQ
jgi:hypothetical protein